MTLDLEFQPYRLFPYERDLAMREIDALGLEVIAEAASRLTVRGSVGDDELARLTYFQTVTGEGTVLEPDSARFERRHLERRALPRARQATRYLVHGMHEYKGKFHPQLVRAFANLLGVAPGDTVLDPFCGSGTTLVETSLMRADSVGLDLSPIAVLITRAKLAVLADADRYRLAEDLETWATRMVPRVASAYDEGFAGAPPWSPEASAYLSRWFTPHAFAGLTEVIRGLEVLQGQPAAHAVASVAISSVLRGASEQAPEDLRIRRRDAAKPAGKLPALLQGALATAMDAVLETAESDDRIGSAQVHLLDATKAGAIQAIIARPEGGGRLTVITSPPYATALPYIDTDRLSIVALGLAEPQRLGQLEGELVGSREWQTNEAAVWAERLRDNADALPDDVWSVCKGLAADMPNGAGFRRARVAPLLYRYFADMGRAFREVRAVLRPGEQAVFVVGVNRTSTSTGQFVIDTPRLLAAVAQTAGFAMRELIELGTWPRYSLHQMNAVRGESAVLLVAA